jgi:TolB-like protein
MFTDMVGYTALTQLDESLAMEVLVRHNRLLKPFFPRFNGREVKAIGDSFLVEFESALDAVKCAVELQSYLHDYNVSSKEERKIMLRIGIHLGDVIHQGGDVFGDAVNIASRIEPIADPGGVCVSEQVFAQVRNKVPQPFDKLGPKDLKNVQFPVDVYKVQMPWEVSATSAKEPRLPATRIAILPFTNISPDPQDEYFADGMTEEIISTISKVAGLKVIARTSVVGYKNSQKKIDQIAKELGVGTILEGSVRKAGDRLRITAQLIDAQTSDHLWAESYDRELKDVFAIQSDISKTVVEALKVKLLSTEKRDIEKRPTESVEAYQAYLKGRYHLNQDTKEDYAKAMNYFGEAVKRDPRFALAYAGISDYYHGASHSNWLSPEEAFPSMKEHAMKALEIDPRLAEGHAALGAVYFHYDWKWRDAEKEFARAIELKPSYVLVYDMYSYLLAVMGRPEESYEKQKEKSELSPEYGTRGWGAALSFAALRLGRTKEGIARLEEIVKADPDSAILHHNLGFAYCHASKIEDAIAELGKAVALSQGDLLFKGDLALTLATTGRNEEADSILKELEEASKSTYVSEVQIGQIQYCLGRHDEAFQNLEKAFERRAIDLPDVRTSLPPYAVELRADPRWTSIESRMGLRDA